VSPTLTTAGAATARTRNPFTVALGDNLDATWDSYLRTQSSHWSHRGVQRELRQHGWLGVASISVPGGTHITQDTVKLNDTYFTTAQYNTPARRNLVSCQVGSTFQLDHQGEDFTNANQPRHVPGLHEHPSTNQNPNKHDWFASWSVSTRTWTPRRPSGRRSRVAVGRKWETRSRAGVPARRRPASGQSTYVRDFGGGDKVHLRQLGLIGRRARPRVAGRRSNGYSVARFGFPCREADLGTAAGSRYGRCPATG
jgi:hypothetical protein